MMLNIDGTPMQVRLERMQGSPGPKRVAAYWYWIAGRFTSDPIEAKLFQIAGALTSGDQSAAAIAITVVETDDADKIKAALQRFLDATPNLNTYLTKLAKAR
jgi:EpsI family protein